MHGVYNYYTSRPVSIGVHHYTTEIAQYKDCHCHSNGNLELCFRSSVAMVTTSGVTETEKTRVYSWKYLHMSNNTFSQNKYTRTCIHR